MKKIKKIILDICEGVAVLLMIAPLGVILQYKELGNDFIWIFILTILYDINTWNKIVTNMNLISTLKDIKNILNDNTIGGRKIEYKDKCDIIKIKIDEILEENVNQ